MFGWIQDFLYSRRQRVIVNGSYSCRSPVLSRIPQGSILSPVLFICYVNDMPGVIQNGISMYVDQWWTLGGGEGVVAPNNLRLKVCNVAPEKQQ